jgi:tRNA-splicing endonuclease subunit Sen54
MLATNLEGAILTSRALLRACMRSRLKNYNRGGSSSSSSIDDSVDPATTEDSPAPSKCIINISSLLGLKGVTGTVTYAATKAGLLGLTRSVAVEAAETLRGGRRVMVRSNAIVPGYIDTPMIEGALTKKNTQPFSIWVQDAKDCRGTDFGADRTAQLRDRIPLNRFGMPAEIADAAVFLASNEYANNCVLNLDGGLSAV